jgi:hypothetical protein
MTGQWYRDKVFVTPYAGTIGDSFILKDDNPPPHQVRIVHRNPFSTWSVSLIVYSRTSNFSSYVAAVTNAGDRAAI